MVKDTPFNSCFSVGVAFTSQGSSEIGIFKQADTAFGGVAPFLQEAEVFILKLFFERGNGARADAVDQAELVEMFPAFGGVEAAIARVADGLAVVFGNAHEAGFYEFAVRGRLVLNEFPINDESVRLLGEIEPVSKFNFRGGLTAHNDGEVRVIEAENLIGVGDAAFPDDPFMGLMNGLGQLFENEPDAIEHHLSF